MPSDTKLLILTPPRIMSLTARSKASDVQAVAGHSKTQWKRFLVSRDISTALTFNNKDRQTLIWEEAERLYLLYLTRSAWFKIPVDK